MDISGIVQAISSVGFPIVMCIYVTHYMQTEQKDMRDAITKLEIAIMKLTERMGNGDDHKAGI